MPLVLADRVRDTTASTGTGAVTLSGVAPIGFQNFTAVGNGNTTYYTIDAGSQWEVGIGTYSSTGPTLSRDTVLSSSNAGALVNFASGNKDVFVTYPSGKSVYSQASDNVGIGTSSPGRKLSVAGGGIAFDDATTTPRSLHWGNGVIYPVLIQGDATTGALMMRTNTAGNSGEERMRVEADGDVGIGTSAPSFRLDVHNSAANTVRSYCTDATGTSYAALSAGTAAGVNSIMYSYSGAGWYGTTTNHPVVFLTNNSERMRIDSSGSGNVLIGTTTNKNRLTVTAGANTNAPVLGSAGGIAYFTNTDVTYGLNIGTSAVDGHVWLQAQRTDTNVVAYNLTLNEAGGNVGIGTNSPGQRLVVSGADTNGSTIRLANTTGTSEVILSLDAGNNGLSQRDSQIRGGNNGSNQTYIDFYTANAAVPVRAMRIANTGNVGIGTTAANERLTVFASSGVQIGATDGTVNQRVGYCLGGTAYSGAASNHAYALVTNDVERIRIDTAGNVLVGTPSLATTATDGFPYIPTCAGVPTGTPTAKTGFAPMVVDSTNNKLYVYIGGAWRIMN